MKLTVESLRHRLHDDAFRQAHFVLVGDVHGDYANYCKIVSQAHCSLQVGDMVGKIHDPEMNDGKGGWRLDRYEALSELDSGRHKFIGGNHENYQTVNCGSLHSIHSFQRGDELVQFCHMPPHCLGHYGVWRIPGIEGNKELSGDIFFLRGAWSIDSPGNPFGIIETTLGVDFFPEEELTMDQCYAAAELYKSVKPDFVVTHACPKFFQSQLQLVGTGKSQQTDGKQVETRTTQLLDYLYEIHQPKIWVFGHYHQSKIAAVADTLFVCLERSVYHAPLNLINGACLYFDKQLNLIMR